MDDRRVGDVDLVRVYHGTVVTAQVDRIVSETRALRPRIPLDRQLLLHLTNGDGSGRKMRAALDGLDLEVREFGGGSIRSWVAGIRSALEEGRPRWVHGHSFQATLPAALARWRSDHRSFRLIHEVHGATAFESLHRNRRRLDRFGRFAGIYLLESVAAALADSLLLVSDEIARYYPVARLRPRVAVPRYVWARQGALDEKSPPGVAEVEAFVGTEDEERPTVVYSGSASEWQLPTETVRLMKAMVDRLGFRALVLTTEPETFRGLVEDEVGAPGSSWMITKVPRPSVLPCLEHCDVGLLLREDRIFNRVACPTKLYQYLYAGLAVVTSPAVRAARPFLEAGVAIEVEPERLAGPGSYVDEAFEERLADAWEAARSSSPSEARLTWQGAGREQLFDLYGLEAPDRT